MNPRDFVIRIDALITAGRDQDALELAACFASAVMPQLAPEDFFRVSSMLEGAELAVSAAEAPVTSVQSS